MKEYMLLFRGGLNFETAAPEEINAAMQKWKTWIEGIAAEGLYKGGERLTHSGGTVLSGASRHMTDGPFAEGKEMVGGFIAIQAENDTHAAEIARGCPIFDYDGAVEVREIARR
jgi:hypothetical protein